MVSAIAWQQIERKIKWIEREFYSIWMESIDGEESYVYEINSGLRNASQFYYWNTKFTTVQKQSRGDQEFAWKSAAKVCAEFI